jgi:DNA-binding MarR family transcriptional regulator
VARRQEVKDWNFLTSQALALVEIARTPDATIRELAERTGLTERQLHRVLDDLVVAGYVSKQRVGRRNRYKIDLERPMRHPSTANHRIGALIAALIS